MRLLAVETATAVCSAAVLVGDRVVAEQSKAMERGHAEALMPMVAAVLEAAKSACPQGFADLDGIAVTVGPGAFTGVRIGLAAARAMGLAAGLPVLGLTTLEVVAAAQAPIDLPLLVALHSKRADVYAQLFGVDRTPLTEPMALLPDTLSARLPAGTIALAGDAAAVVAAALEASGRTVKPMTGPARPEAAALARLAAARWQSGLPRADDAPPRPLYLRPPDVSPAPPKPRR